MPLETKLRQIAQERFEGWRTAGQQEAVMHLRSERPSTQVSSRSPVAVRYCLLPRVDAFRPER